MLRGSRARATLEPAGRNHEKILLVDDEPAVRVLLSRQLSRVGFAPVVAATGEEALALSQSEQFRVVITDLEMSGMGGLALLQRLSPLQPQARFLVITGRGAVPGELLPRGHRIRIFPKPWDERELVAAIRGADSGTSCSALPSLAPLQEWPKTHVLLIESDEAGTFSFCADLDARRPGEFATTVASDVATACVLLQHHTFDVIAFVLQDADVASLEALARLQGEAPHIGIVVVTPIDDPKFAVQAIQAGAQDCLVRHQLKATSLRRALRHTIERKRAEWRLASIAFHDPLTGLANRSLFRQRVAQAAAFAKRSQGHFAVLVLDMDRFKFINDSLGHDAGDAFLQEVAQRLQLATRETDTVARLGGDEFAVLATPLASPADIDAVSERILAELRRPVELGSTRLEPTASIGAALFPGSGRNSDTLLSAADAALYVVKENGRNGFRVHGTQLERRVARELKLEQRVRRAVELEQFCLHYQPQVAPAGEFLGAEALLRWAPSPEVRLEAGEFMRILEQTGLIVKLGPWIVETACKQLRRWREAGCWVDRVSINISGRQVIERDFVSRLRAVTAEAGIQCQEVELELSESTLQGDKQALLAVLSELSGHGYRLALDNFGTGYGSLTFLRDFFINTLKIDRRFVQSVKDDSFERRLVGGIIGMVNHLGLSVVAEGVESEEQLELLRADGCNLAQGYLFGAAMPPEQFAIEVQRSASPDGQNAPASRFISRRVPPRAWRSEPALGRALRG